MKTSNKSSPRNWDSNTEWYSSMTGYSGSKYHQKVAYPIVINQIKKTFGKQRFKLLDVGCGNGTFYKHISQMNCEYTGVDISGKMISSARKLNPKKARFTVGDISKTNLNQRFDVAVSIFSLQDISDLNDTIKNIAYCLNEMSKLLVFMKHPSFNIPRISGWVKDKKRKLSSKRIDTYLKEKAIPLEKKRGKKTYVNVHFHRPLSSYINTLSKHFVIEEIREIEDSVRVRNKEIPSFLYIECRRK